MLEGLPKRETDESRHEAGYCSTSLKRGRLPPRLSLRPEHSKMCIGGFVEMFEHGGSAPADVGKRRARRRRRKSHAGPQAHDEWPDTLPRAEPDEVEVYSVLSDIKPGPRALRTALACGILVGSFRRVGMYEELLKRLHAEEARKRRFHNLVGQANRPLTLAGEAAEAIEALIATKAEASKKPAPKKK